MKYFKIKIISPKESPRESFELSEDAKNVLKEIGLDVSTEFTAEQDRIVKEIYAERKSFVHFFSKGGFKLTGSTIATVFTEDDMQDPCLREYLQDKKYDIVETIEPARFMRYRRE